MYTKKLLSKKWKSLQRDSQISFPPFADGFVDLRLVIHPLFSARAHFASFQFGLLKCSRTKLGFWQIVPICALPIVHHRLLQRRLYDRSHHIGEVKWRIMNFQ